MVYSVPTLREIAELPWNGYKAVSTFSGAGGSCTGYRMAGYKLLWMNEFIPEARSTYSANTDSTIVDGRDIRKVDYLDILNATGLDVGEIDLFDGSPPCAAFSTMGKRSEGWGKKKNYSDSSQRVDDLFYEYIRLVKGCQPKVFVAENVSGLIKGVAKGYFLNILKAMKDCGYRVSAKVLDASWLGVPQSRERLIFIGVREDLQLEPVFPKPFARQITVGESFATIPQPDRSQFYPIPDGKMRILWENTRPGDVFATAYKRLWGKPNMFAHRKFSMDLTAPTVLQGSSSLYHPTERRSMTIAELKRVCSFPDDFILTGSFSQQWERLGRAVPPLMMRAIANTVKTEILDRAKLS
jgi:DNA (cytosine-5)-methyltransferase 1